MSTPALLALAFFILFTVVDVAFWPKVIKHYTVNFPGFPLPKVWSPRNTAMNAGWAAIAGWWGWWLLPIYYAVVWALKGWIRLMYNFGLPLLNEKINKKKQQLAFSSTHEERKVLAKEIKELEEGRERLLCTRNPFTPRSYEIVWGLACVAAVIAHHVVFYILAHNVHPAI